MEQDFVDVVIAEWGKEVPDLDTVPLEIVGRINRLSRIMRGRIEQLLAEQGLTYEFFDVLVALRRAGPPYQKNPTQLSQSLTLSPGSMTNRLDRLEQAGFVRRLPDPTDRRGTLVQLTQVGFNLISSIIHAQAENMGQMLKGITEEERDRMRADLRKLLLSLEPIR